MTSKDLFSIDNIGGINDKIKNQLVEAEIYAVKDLVVRGAMNVSEATGISIDKCNRICSKARSRLEQLGIMNRPFTTTTYKEIERISLGSKSLDDLLGGEGLQTGAITEFFGESNTGKTQICHTLSVMVQLGRHRGGLDGKAIYIDTESTFRRERIVSIAEAKGLEAAKATKNIIIARPMSSSEQEHYLEMAGSIIEEHKNVRLLIVDCVTSLYRAEYIGRARLPERHQRLLRYMQMLRRFSEVYEVVVLVTNQVNESPDCYTAYLYRHRPIGGNIMAHTSTYRIRLGQFGDKLRVLRNARIPLFLCRKSNHIFTVWQHMVLLVIRQYEGKSYRMFSEWLVEAYYLRTFLQLSHIPHFTTLQKFTERINGILLEKSKNWTTIRWNRFVWIQSNPRFSVLHRKSKTKKKIH